MSDIHPKISVIVPVFNTEDYLDRCISSILNQTYENLEVILVDDGSTDGSLAKCMLYAQRDSRIKLLQQKNMGLSAARNAGLDIASGEYISFVDSDDFIDKNTYSILVNCLGGRKDVDMLIFGYRVIKDEKSIYEYKDCDRTPSKFDIIEELFEGKNISNAMWNKLYKANCFNSIRFTHGKVYEDIYIQYKLIYNSNNFIVCHHVLYNYVMRDNSITHSSNVAYALDLLDVQVSRFLNIPFRNEKITAYASRSIFSAYINFIYLMCKMAKNNMCEIKDRRILIENSIYNIYPYIKSYLSKKRRIIVFLLLKNNKFFDFSIVMLKFLRGKCIYIKNRFKQKLGFQEK